MRATCRLADTPWVLLRERDLAALTALRSTDGGFAHGASAQACYYPDGTLIEARRIRRVLGALGPLPSLEAVRRVEPELRLEHYALDHDGPRWWLRHATPSFESPFDREAWYLCFTASGVVHRFAPGTVADGLALFARLDGSRGPDAIGPLSPAQRDLLAFLVRYALVVGSLASPMDVRALPELLFLAHAGFAVRAGDDLVVVDPLAAHGLSRDAGERDLFRLLQVARGVVFSHHHWDHLHVQTLMRIPRETPLLVPAASARASYANPPLAPYLRGLGFSDVRELADGAVAELGRVTVRALPFFGEPFGCGSHFDGMAYVIDADGRRIVGTVDTGRDEAGDMDAIIDALAAEGRPDLVFFGASGQSHQSPVAAAGLRHFSNELAWHPDLMTYHPTVADVARWLARLEPRCAAPYAQFLLAPEPPEIAAPTDLRGEDFFQSWSAQRHTLPARHEAWCASIDTLAQARGRMGYLRPRQGVRW